MRFDEELLAGVHCPEPEDMATAAAKLAPLLPENLTLQLVGKMGAGKTFFASSLSKALGVTEPVTSPSYDLVATYHSPSHNLVHVDAFRLETEGEMDKLGIEDLLVTPWLLLVEWPENAPELYFGKIWRIFIESPKGGGRDLCLRDRVLH